MPLTIDTIKTHGRFILLTAITIAMMGAATEVAADGSRSRGKIRAITPMTEVGSHRSNLQAGDYFDVVGILNDVSGNRVTIGDRELTLAPGVRTSRANPYHVVGVKLNRAGEVVVFDLISDDPS